LRDYGPDGSADGITPDTRRSVEEEELSESFRRVTLGRRSPRVTF
jgi:hypothetical protein